MKEILASIEVKLDRLDEHVDKVDIILAKQEENFKEHMRRTHLLEVKADHPKPE